MLSCRERQGGVVSFYVCVGAFVLASTLSGLLDPEWGCGTTARTRVQQNHVREQRGVSVGRGVSVERGV
jgi:hypothetical protein